MTPAAGDVVDLDAAEVEGGSYGASFGGETLGAEPLDRGGGGDEDGDDLRDDDDGADLRLGLGGALTTAGDLGLGWKTALAVPLRLGDHLRPEVTLGASGATAGERHAGAELGVGVRW